MFVSGSMVFDFGGFFTVVGFFGVFLRGEKVGGLSTVWCFFVICEEGFFWWRGRCLFLLDSYLSYGLVLYVGS